MPLPDLMALVHARDAAEAKVAAIGAVNPRAGGPINWLAQQVEEADRARARLARARAGGVQSQCHGLHPGDAGSAGGNAAELRRGQSGFTEIQRLREEDAKRAAAVDQEMQELKDIRGHWAEWRAEWEHTLVVNETKLLRGLAELNASFLHRSGQTEAFFRDQVKLQHAEFTAAVERSGVDIQKRLWADLEKVRRISTI